MRNVKLEIKPFNKFLFRSCYYQQLISTYSFYGTEESKILLNSMPIYIHNKNKLFIEEIEILKPKELEKLTGLKQIKNSIANGIINDIICSIKNNTPVIIAVDCYELPYLPTTFQIEHKVHYLLIYGFDLDAKTFAVSENRFENSDCYGEKLLSFDLIEKAIESYKKFLIRKNGISSVVLQRTSSPNIKISASNAYLYFFRKNRKLIQKSINQLCRGFHFIESIIFSEESLSLYYDKLIEFFEDCRTKKIVQKKQLGCVFESTEPYERILNRIIENCIFIYGVLLKMQLTKKYNRLSAEKILLRISEIISLENELIKELFD